MQKVLIYIMVYTKVAAG